MESTLISSRYETDEILNQYLLFHYGRDRDLMPFSFGPREALNFPVRCVEECFNKKASMALELGCAVGRSSFELSRYCKSVLAVDNSSVFISAAQQIQQQGYLDYTILGEGTERSVRTARIPEGIEPGRIHFKCCDVMDVPLEAYDVVLAANLLCRLRDPSAFLKRLREWVVPGGKLILTTPFSWLEEFTPRSHWLSAENVDRSLEEYFELERAFDMPFLIREHLRKYQWGVTRAAIWKRRESVSARRA